MNIQSRNSMNGIKKVSNEQHKIILSFNKAILLVIIILILFYLTYYTYKYYSVACENKIPLYQYLTNFGNQSFCILLPQNISENTINHTISEENELNIMNSIKNVSDEVFQISNQLYTYDQAKCKCESYGTRLATKSELTQAYNNGAHWCNYGWIEGNEAYYPVQQCELDRKAKNIKDYNEILKKHYEDPNKYTLKMVNDARQKMYRENSLDFCGSSAGLNGGLFENKNIKFGATCFGKKPAGMSVREKDAKCNDPFLSEEIEKINKEDVNKATCGGISKDDVISSFNYDTWNQK